MCAGLVCLKPGDSIGKHSTKNYEEPVMFFDGCGKVEISGHKPIKVKAGMLVYNPPRTEHNVINTGKKILRYIYIVAKTKT